MMGSGETTYGSLHSIHTHWRLIQLLGVQSLYATLSGSRLAKQSVLYVPCHSSYPADSQSRKWKVSSYPRVKHFSAWLMNLQPGTSNSLDHLA